MKTKQVQVVNRRAASLPGVKPLPIERNHHDVSKFETDEEDGYKSITLAIKQLVEEESANEPKRITFDKILAGSGKFVIEGGHGAGAMISVDHLDSLSRSFVVASPEVREVCKASPLLHDLPLKHSSILRQDPGLRGDQKWRISRLVISRNPSPTWVYWI